MTPPPSARRGNEICDIFVRCDPTGNYTFFATHYLDEARELVRELREDPEINWAYCTDPRPEDSRA